MGDRRRAALMLAVATAVAVIASPAPAQAPAATIQSANLVNQGIELLRLAPSVDNYKQAVDLFTQAVAADPSYSTAHYYLGVAQYHLATETLLGDPLGIDSVKPGLTAGIASLNKAIELAPAASGPRVYLGRIYLLLGETDRAAAVLQEELRIAPATARAEAHEALGAVLMRQGFVVDGLRHFEWALDLDKNYARAMYDKALALRDLGRYEECIALCDKLDRLLSDYTRDAALLERQGSRNPHAVQDTYEKLMERYRRTAEFKSANMWPEVFKLQAGCFTRLRRYANARGAYMQAMDPRNGGNPESQELRTLLARQYMLEAKWVVRTEGRVVDPLRLLKATDNKITEILKSNATYPPAWQLRGETYLLEAQVYRSTAEEGVHQLEDARTAFVSAVDGYRKARAENSRLPEVRSGRAYAECLARYGYCLVLLGQEQEALPLFDEGLSKDADPTSWECMIYKALALSKTDPIGKRSAIAKLVADGRAAAPDQYEAHLSGGTALLNCGLAVKEMAEAPGGPDLGGVVLATLNDAGEAFRAAMGVAPRDAEARILEAECYYQSGQLGPARRAYEDALKLIPTSKAVNISDTRATVLLRLAVAYLQTGVYERAIERANECLAVSSQTWEALEVLGDAYLGLKRYTAADEAYQRAFAKAPADSAGAARILASHGHLYLTMGKAQEAELYLLRALDMFSRTPTDRLTKDQRDSLARAQSDLQTAQQQKREVVTGPS